MEKEYRHNNKVAIYRSADGETQLSVEIDKDTVWLNANQMAELFGRDSKTIRKHINNAIREELAGEVVVAKFATTAADGKTYMTEHYNLNVHDRRVKSGRKRKENDDENISCKRLWNSSRRERPYEHAAP